MLFLRKSRKGFTLIELMVVVAIIGVLALLGLRVYSTQQDKAKEALVKANVGSVQVTIQTALVDTSDLTIDNVANGIKLSDLMTLRNPYSGKSGSDTDGDIANVVVYLAVADDADDATTTAEGVTGDEGTVGIYANAGTDPTAFYIVGFGKDGDLIPNYTLTAQR